MRGEGNFSGRRARNVIHRYCMTSIISVRDLRSRYVRLCEYFFLSFRNAILHISRSSNIQNTGIETGYQPPSVLQNMTKTCNVTRQAEFFTSRCIINILFECTRPKRILQKEERAEDGMFAESFQSTGALPARSFPRRNEKSCGESDTLTINNMIIHRCRSVKWLHKLS